MSEDMPKVWWSPSDRSLYAKRFDHGYSEIAGEYDIDELPSDAVLLLPVSDAPAAPGETASCGVCKLGARVLYIDDRCSEHGDTPW